MVVALSADLSVDERRHSADAFGWRAAVRRQGPALFGEQSELVRRHPGARPHRGLRPGDQYARSTDRQHSPQHVLHGHDAAGRRPAPDQRRQPVDRDQPLQRVELQVLGGADDEHRARLQRQHHPPGRHRPDAGRLVEGLGTATKTGENLHVGAGLARHERHPAGRDVDAGQFQQLGERQPLLAAAGGQRQGLLCRPQPEHAVDRHQRQRLGDRRRQARRRHLLRSPALR